MGPLKVATKLALRTGTVTRDGEVTGILSNFGPYSTTKFEHGPGEELDSLGLNEFLIRSKTVSTDFVVLDKKYVS